ncbi:MAG: T9SS type A sorting domain-containing protein, partial [Bacteroidetes bacterium]|nr:T9SS type A sorting domain-containing protein [Bacteroidota bacterium]
EFDETFQFVGVEDGPLAQVPSGYSLGQNYPNPFNPSTTIAYDVPAASNVSINIYDMLGRNVITLVNEQKNAGSYTVEWNGKNSSGIQVTSGIYFYRLEAGQSAITKKMLLLR